MGLAIDWLSQSERENLFFELLPGAKKQSGYVLGCCPFHGEKRGSLSYQPEKDLFKCFSCGVGGDLIKLFTEVNFRGDEKAGFLAFKKRFGPLEDGKKPWRPREFKGPPVVHKWEPSQFTPPPGLWSERAASFVAHSQERLAQKPEVLKQLLTWGLTPEAIGAGRLGWNDAWKAFPGAAWGLGKDDGKISLPPGLVIPFSVSGVVVKLKIRRPEADARPRYLAIRGSANTFYTCGRGAKIMIVESERDALMLWGVARDLGSFWATGSATARPCTRTDKLLKEARQVLVSLDSDEAGAKNARDFWLKNYKCKWWPLPGGWGKDPGEAKDKDLRLWVKSSG